jgi:hypothetical protein
MFDKSRTRHTAIVTQGKDKHGGPPLIIYGGLNEGAGNSSLRQSTHLWTDPRDAVAAHRGNLYNRAEEGP